MQRLLFEPVTYRNNTLFLIDQRLLPGKFQVLRYTKVRDVWSAIRTMVVRGAPAIGVTAAYAMHLAVCRTKSASRNALIKDLSRAGRFLISSRPTAVNLAWAVQRVLKAAQDSNITSVERFKQMILSEAKSIHREDIGICSAIGRFGARLIRNNFNILTYCNAGGLATTGYGTALAPMFEAKKRGVKFHVYSCETRPLLQGARLTMWELMRYKINATMICDNSAASLMKQGTVDLVITGADRIVRSGDTANKIGTYGIACLAAAHGIPFYVAAPSSTFDFSKKSGAQIPIEMRNASEVTHLGGKQIAPKNARARNAAFDVTPAELIEGFITEAGILRKPFHKSFKQLDR